jgi:exosortase E/protease (VPEID-CTERM system)
MLKVPLDPTCRFRGNELTVERLLWWIFLGLLLGTELITITPGPSLYSHLRPYTGWLWPLVLYPIRPAAITGVMAWVFLSWPIPQQEVRRVLSQSERPMSRAWLWLAVHLVLLGVACSVNLSWRTAPITSVEQAVTRLWLWRAICLPVYASWALAVLPPLFWIRWFTRGSKAFFAGIALGFVGDFFGGFTQALYWPLQRSTFQVVRLFLRLSGQTVVAWPDQLIIGTRSFSIQIWPACSGLEGIGLTCVFLAVYLCFFRRQLRFPQSLLLLPFGIVISWLMNSVRITALILIGGWSVPAAVQGFHSIAGWLFFNFVACGLVWASWRFSFFARATPRSAAWSSPNPAAVYLVPFLALIASSIITQAFTTSFGVLYPVRVAAVIAALWVYRHDLARLKWRPSFSAAGLGVLAFVFWTALAHRNSAFDITSRTAFSNLTSFSAGWIAFRLLGSIITVPLAEELAFRGYLIRKLVNPEFFSPEASKFTWVSFLGSSVLFGWLHEQWLVGTIAGMIFAWAFYRRKLVCDAIMAHSTTNALLSLYVLATGNWSLWT